ncbi:hypothetical protein [Sphingomonas sp. PAMC 26605]|uniref:hypothetical protein n=1 Tax=Sphingomonas sp. PAMC 26605 TaxID=1112214 RepID=UPI00026CB5BE|nr:hypothetical protein [Sphingomonas sp. PAMC 26605]
MEDNQLLGTRNRLPEAQQVLAAHWISLDLKGAVNGGDRGGKSVHTDDLDQFSLADEMLRLR